MTTLSREKISTTPTTLKRYNQDCMLKPVGPNLSLRDLVHTTDLSYIVNDLKWDK